MAGPSPVGDTKIVSSISTFVLNTLTLKKIVFFFKMVELAQTRQQHEYASSIGLLAINLFWLCVIAQCGDCYKRKGTCNKTKKN